MTARASNINNAPTPRGRSRIGAWLDHHAYSFVASVGRMLAKPWATLLTVGVMAVALALPLGLWGVLANVERLAGDVRQSRQVSVFLQPTVDAARAVIRPGPRRGCRPATGLRPAPARACACA